MTRDEEKLIAIHQLRTNMQLLDDSNLPQEKKNQALENLFDAYLQYQEITEATPTAPVKELKKTLTDSVSFNLDLKNIPQSQEKLEKILILLTHFSKNNVLNNSSLLENITALSQELSTAQKISEQLAQMETQKPVIDQENINKLLNKATSQSKREKEAANKQKTADKDQEKIKIFLESAFAKKQENPSQKINLSKVEVKIEDGKKRLIITNDKQQSVRYAIYPYKKAEILGNDTSTANNMKTLLALLEKNNPLTFDTPKPKEKQKTAKGYTFQNFCDDTGLKLSKSQAPDLADELKGYNTLLSQGDESASNLLQKLKNKYKYQTLLQQKAQAEQNITSLQSKTNQAITGTFTNISPEDLLSLSAPASAQNQDMLQLRQHFAEVTNLLCQPNALSTARQKALNALRKEETFWKDMNEAYYPQIKKVAQDNFYQVCAQQMFGNSKKPHEILEDTSAYLSPDLAKKVLARSVIVYGMGNANRKPDPQKTNEILQTFGYRINLKQVNIESDNKLRSKLVTAIMRCLADGHPLDMTKFNRDEQSLFRIQKQKLKNTFGKDKNYDNLVDSVLNDKAAQKTIAPTAYQKHNMEIGLLAALSPEFTNQIDFSEKIRRSLPETEQKQWKLEDYLFTKYVNLYFQQDISPSNKELIKKLKNGYDWEGFKTQNKFASTQIYRDFMEINQPTETIILNALIEGKLKGEQHHNKHLKNAPFSKDPLNYNDTLVTSVQHKMWHENPHQHYHLATVEGTDLIPPYCVKTPDGKFTRCGQIDIKDGYKVYYENLQILDKNGQYRDLISEDSFYLSSSGCHISKPHLTQKALDFSRQNKQNIDLER